MAEFIQLIVVMLVFLLWLAVLAAFVRPFGVRLPVLLFGKRKSTAQSLSFSQHMWLIGVLSWGCGMWIVTTLSDYLDWKYWDGSAHNLSAGRLLFHAALWPLGGLLFGWMSWNTRMGKAES